MHATAAARLAFGWRLRDRRGSLLHGRPALGVLAVFGLRAASIQAALVSELPRRAMQWPRIVVHRLTGYDLHLTTPVT
jgi:hypothetical protein